MANKKQQLAACLLMLVGLCNGTHSEVDAQQMSDRSDEDFGLIGAQRYSTSMAPMVAFGQQRGGELRFRRQLTVPADSPLNLQGPQQPSGGSNFFSKLGELGPQLTQVSSLFSSSSQQGSQQQQQPGAGQLMSNPFASLGSLGGLGGGGQPGQQGNGFNMQNIMRQLSDFANLIRSTQERQARTLEATTRSAQEAGNQSMDAARTAQSGIMQALTEMGQGLQRLATNNPSLVPDIKNLYQSVATRLSSASSSVTQAAGQPEAGLPALPKPQSSA